MTNIKDLCETLIKHNVKSFKQDSSSIEIEFFGVAQPAERHTVNVEDVGSTPSPGTNEIQMPLDLRTENINNHDHVLNWSATPDPQEGAMPLTGEQPEA